VWSQTLLLISQGLNLGLAVCCVLCSSARSNSQFRPVLLLVPVVPVPLRCCTRSEMHQRTHGQAGTDCSLRTFRRTGVWIGHFGKARVIGSQLLLSHRIPQNSLTGCRQPADLNPRSFIISLATTTTTTTRTTTIAIAP
jgi:hypothetical protein